MSYRTAIAEGIKAALAGRLNDAGAIVADESIFTALERPLNPEYDFPAVVIYTLDSRRGPQDYGNSLTPRIVEVAIEAGVVGSHVDALARAQALADQVEYVLRADQSLGGLVNRIEWRETVSDQWSVGAAAGGTTVGVSLLQYQVDIYTQEVDPHLLEPVDGPDTTPGGVIICGHPVPSDEFDPIRDGDKSPIGDAPVCDPVEGCDLPAYGGDDACDHACGAKP